MDHFKLVKARSHGVTPSGRSLEGAGDRRSKSAEIQKSRKSEEREGIAIATIRDLWTFGDRMNDQKDRTRYGAKGFKEELIASSRRKKRRSWKEESSGKQNYLSIRKIGYVQSLDGLDEYGLYTVILKKQTGKI
uniref:Uncharacterized protein n=1 Tax=Steinernema glaseri TaxID=37863 RepID=A0A1I7YI53_9BILA